MHARLSPRAPALALGCALLLGWQASAAGHGASGSGAGAGDSAASSPPRLLAGAGKASIDPGPAQLPIRNHDDAPLVSIHDSLYARALVLRSGPATSVIVVVDAIMLPDDFCAHAVARIAAAMGTPREHVLLAATHAHTVPWSMDNGYGDAVLAGITAAVAQAAGRLEPVRVARGDGRAYINMNRDEAVPGGFILGQDPEGPSDKTLRVVAFYRSDGSPLAILANYAVHAVALYSSDTAGSHAAMVSADIPGVVDRFVDEHYGAGRTLTLWTSGAAGDQNPIMMSYHAEPGSDGKVRPSDLGPAGFALVDRLGQALALEVIRVADRLAPADASGLPAAQGLVSCPQKVVAGAAGDSAPAGSVRVGYFGIGGIGLVTVSGEVTTLLDRHLREQPGVGDPVLVTLANGYSGYLPDDASYARGNTFEVEKSAFAPGCVEGAVIGGVRRLLGAAPN